MSPLIIFVLIIVSPFVIIIAIAIFHEIFKPEYHLRALAIKESEAEIECEKNARYSLIQQEIESEIDDARMLVEKIILKQKNGIHPSMSDLHVLGNHPEFALEAYDNIGIFLKNK